MVNLDKLPDPITKSRALCGTLMKEERCGLLYFSRKAEGCTIRARGISRGGALTLALS